MREPVLANFFCLVAIYIKVLKTDITMVFSDFFYAGDVQSYHTGYSIVDQDFTGAVIVPDVGFSHTEHLVLEEDSSAEAVNVVGEVLSTKQLILRRGPVVFLAVIMLLIGVLVRLLTGNG